MLGANVEYGEDMSNTRIRGVGKSYLSFDWSDEAIHMKSVLKINSALLPPALRPLDAELAFDDVASQGIMIDNQRVGDRHHVIVTISVRRPPKFFIPFEGQGFGREVSRMHRRRATAMDFAASGVVSHAAPACPCPAANAQSELNAGPIPAIPEGPCAYVSRYIEGAAHCSPRSGVRTASLSTSPRSSTAGFDRQRTASRP